MFCHVCITKVNTCLSSMPEILSYTPIISVDQPISQITYIPDSPRFTLRTIRKAITNLGGFQLSIQHDLTLAQRAEKAQAAERRRILYRLLTTFLFVVPTFVVGVVGMMLLSEENSFKHSLETPVWGDSTKGTWVMFSLATPIQFGVGWFFYERAFKSLRGVWRRKRQVPWQRVWFERLFKWGSMDSLVSLGISVAYAASLVYLALDVRRQGMENSTYFDVSVFLIVSSVPFFKASTECTTVLHFVRSLSREFKQSSDRRRSPRTSQDKTLERLALHPFRQPERLFYIYCRSRFGLSRARGPDSSPSRRVSTGRCCSTRHQRRMLF